MSSTETVSHTTAPPVSEASLQVNNQHSLPIIITLILLSFFFLGFFSIYFVRCVLTFFIRRRNTENTTPQPNSKTHGLDPSILSTFPTFVYSSVKDLREDKGILECAVCLSEFEDSDMLRLLTICNHAFHPDCIDLWLGSHTTCPVCRRNLDPSEKPHEISITITEDETSTTMMNEGENGTNHSREEGSHRMVSVHENAEEEEEEEEKSSREQGRRVDDDHDHNHNHEGGGGGEDHVGDDSKRGNGGHVVAVDQMLRSHSTGHSIIRSDVDRYTLRLPENVKESITRGHHHNWTASCITFGEFTGNVTAGKSGLGEASGVSSGDVIRV